eukprot:TRINITY_DN110959_c0_g1_i1.p1 TRINITY_DN110959_c0_g1~~TRINITY_DN110959_c0_g1_i1.p1  ORF type:complete len:254 (-),score=43.33 TRINITY_DN110959_c0_g1_i1:100-861(-)
MANLETAFLSVGHPVTPGVVRQLQPIAASAPLQPRALGGTSWAVLQVLTAGASCVALLSTARGRKRRSVAAHAAASDQTADEEAPRSFFDVAELRVSRRTIFSTATGVVVAAAEASPASAEFISPDLDFKKCLECGGNGTCSCLMCEGSGSYRMYGKSNSPSMQVKAQFEECPNCNGVGKTVCSRCTGTGLNEKQLRGFLRDGEFKKVAARLRNQSVSVATVSRLQADVRQAVQKIKKRREAKLAEKTAQESA